MKKISAVLLALVMILGLAACGSQKETTPAPTEPTTTAAPETTKAPETTAPETTNAPETTAPETTVPESKSVHDELVEAIPGIWQITAWDLVTGGYINVVDTWFLKYTDDTIWFYMDGALVNEEGYEWSDDVTMHFWYKDDPSYVGDWAYELQEDGTLKITYAEYGVIYYCEKRPDDTDPTDYKPAEGGEIEGEAITAADLAGTWDINTMTVAGIETSVAGQGMTYVFTEDSVQYWFIVQINDFSYEFTDEYNIKLVDKTDETNTTVWTLAVQEDGSLLIIDAANSMSYSCTKQQ